MTQDPQRRGSIFSRLYVQLLIAILLGIFVGHFFPRLGANFKPLGDLFIKSIKMLLAPIIFATVTAGIAKMGDIRATGRVGLKALIYFEVVSTFALLTGLAVVNIIRPGAGMNIDPASLDGKAIASFADAAQKHGLLDFFLNIIPTSAVGAFAEGNMLQVILLSVLFGIALSQAGPRKQQFIEMLDIVLAAMFGIIRMVMRLAPIGAFGSMAYTVAKYGVGTLSSFGWLMACLYITCILFIFGVLGPINWFCGVSLWPFLKYIRDEILIVFGTCSTETVLPQMMEKLEKLGCPEALVGLVLPAGYTFNADGTSIYLTMAAIFIAQATNTHLSWADQLVIVLVLVLTSKGSAGVAGAGFVTLAATLASMDKIPVAGLVLLLGVDSFLNQARAVTNVIGNGVATIAIARWEGLFDDQKARRVLSSR